MTTYCNLIIPKCNEGSNPLKWHFSVCYQRKPVVVVGNFDPWLTAPTWNSYHARVHRELWPVTHTAPTWTPDHAENLLNNQW